MNTMKTPSIVQIEAERLSTLMTQVKETVARDVIVSNASPKKKTFGVVDLWKCRKMRRTNGIIIR